MPYHLSTAPGRRQEVVSTRIEAAAQGLSDILLEYCPRQEAESRVDSDRSCCIGGFS